MKKFLYGLIAAALLWTSPTFASQGSICMPTTGTVSGLTLVTDINAALKALLTANSGASAPANDCTGLAVNGQLWMDTNTNTAKLYNGAAWLSLGRADTGTGIWNGIVGGGVSSLASATTPDLCGTSNSHATINITGTTTITGFGSNCVAGTWKVVTFAAALTLTHNGTTFILPNGGSDITTAAGDSMLVATIGTGQYRVVSYIKADGTPIAFNALFTASVSFTGTITPTILAGNTNDWAPTSFSTANTVRASASSAINLTGLAGGAAGRYIILQNAGTFNITLLANNASSSAANRFGFAGPLTLQAGQAITLIYDGTASLWRALSPIQSQAIAAGFKNLRITNDPTNGTTLNSNMVITADAVTLEDANGLAYRATSVNCSAALTTSGAAGLDTGAAAVNTWYSLWVIYNPTTNTQSCLISIQSAQASLTMPAGYTFAARVGWGRTQTATDAYWLRTIQYGRRAQYVVAVGTNTATLPVLDSATAGRGTGTYSTAAPTWFAVAVSPGIPSTASRIVVVVHTIYPPGSSGTAQGVMVGPNGSWGGTINTTNAAQNPWGTVMQSGSGANGGTWAYEFALESTNIYTVAPAGNYAVSALGWEDNI